jgi:hypothetical protein
VEGLRAALLRVVTRRFKKVPAAVLDRVTQAEDPATLEQWLDAALEVRSLRALFSEPRSSRD